MTNYFNSLFLLFASCIFAQSGAVIYNVKVPMAAEEISKNESAFFQEIINIAEKHQFELIFNKNQSSFKMVESLTAANMEDNKNNIARAGFSSSIDVYVDKTKNIEIIQRIDGTLLLADYNADGWEITNESKNISDYLCYKAIRKVPYLDTKGVSKIRLFTAWFAPSLPYNYGPAEFYGLPGLILALTSYKTTFLASKIVLDKQDVQINFPKGKTISKEVYDEKLRENLGM